MQHRVRETKKSAIRSDIGTRFDEYSYSKMLSAYIDYGHDQLKHFFRLSLVIKYHRRQDQIIKLDDNR